MTLAFCHLLVFLYFTLTVPGFLGNLFSVSPREEKLEKAKLLEEQRATDERARREEEERNAAEQRAKHREKRRKVLQEILETEKDFLFDLQLCLTTFLDSDSAIKVRKITCRNVSVSRHDSAATDHSFCCQGKTDLWPKLLLFPDMILLAVDHS